MFVHLRLHSEFSVVDGTNRIDEVVKAAAADQQPALAITDINNLFGAIKFYKETRGKGVKPVVGAEIYLESLTQDAAQTSRMVLLVQTHQGYLNLCELISRGWTQNVHRAVPDKAMRPCDNSCSHSSLITATALCTFCVQPRLISSHKFK